MEMQEVPVHLDQPLHLVAVLAEEVPQHPIVTQVLVALVVLVAEGAVALLVEPAQELVMVVELTIPILLQMVGVMMVDLGDLTVQEAAAVQVLLGQTEVHQTLQEALEVMDWHILLLVLQ
jgi:hypothetical protein